jgi:hypothetical protein
VVELDVIADEDLPSRELPPHRGDPLLVLDVDAVILRCRRNVADGLVRRLRLVVSGILASKTAHLQRAVLRVFERVNPDEEPRRAVRVYPTRCEFVPLIGQLPDPMSIRIASGRLQVQEQQIDRLAGHAAFSFSSSFRSASVLNSLTLRVPPTSSNSSSSFE